MYTMYYNLCTMYYLLTALYCLLCTRYVGSKQVGTTESRVRGGGGIITYPKNHSPRSRKDKSSNVPMYAVVSSTCLLTYLLYLPRDYLGRDSTVLLLA